jgi:hypothetical protein
MRMGDSMLKEKIRVRLKAEDGSTIKVYDSTKVDCDVHDVHTTWGALDPIQQLAVENGLDTLSDLPCLMSPRSVDAKEEA